MLLMAAAFMLSVSTLAASLPFVMSEKAAALSIVKTTSLPGGWYLGDTRSAGFNELVSGGLHVWTVPSNGNSNNLSKAAGYYPANFLLSEAGATAINFASYTGVRPSLQLGVDMDGNGTWDGYLVYEPWAYGTGNWWTSKNFGVHPGMGYPSFGTLADFSAANPHAKVVSVGYSLGSGVVGDAVITSLEAGGTQYTFDTTPPDTQKPTVELVSPTSGVFAAGTPLVINANDNIGLEKIVANVYQTGVSSVYKPSQIALNGALSGTLSVDTTGFPDGSYNVRYNALDTSNNLSITYTFNFTIDNTRPVIAVKGAAWGNVYTPASVGAGNVFQLVNFKLSDNTAVKTVYVNDFNKTITASPWSDVNGVSVGVMGGRYGTNTLYVYDQAGNESSYDFTLDNVAPTVTVKPSPDTIGSGPYQKVSLKLYDQYKVAQAEINGYPIDLSDNVWSDLNNIIPGGSMHGVSGSNVVKVWDVAGNMTQTSFVLDTTAPTATFTYSNNNGNAVTNQDVTVTMTTSEPVVTPDGWAALDTTHFTRVYSDNGKYSVVLTDLAGNVSTPQLYEVKRIDKVAPVFTGITDGMVVHGPVTFTVTDQNFSQLLVNNAAALTTHPGGWDYVPATPLIDDGLYTVTATDKAGNQALVSFTIDNSVIASVDTSAIDTTSTTPILSGLLTYVTDGAPVGGAPLVISVDGINYNVTTDLDGKWSTPVTVTNGQHDVMVTLAEAVVGQATFTTLLAPQTQTPTTTPGTANPTFTTASATTRTTLPSANTGTPGVLGASDAAGTGTTPATDPTGTPDVKGTSTEKTVADAVNNNDGKAFGLAWYWWLLIIAGLAALIWWIIAAIRRRRDEEQ